MRLRLPPGSKRGVGDCVGASFPLTKFSGAPEYLCYIVFVCPTIHVSARLDERLVESLDAEAVKQGRKRSQMLEWVLRVRYFGESENKSVEISHSGNDGK